MSGRRPDLDRSDAEAAVSSFTIFPTPSGRWTWVLWRSDLPEPIAHGREFPTREDAIENTVAVREFAPDAGWATALTDDVGTGRTRWDQLAAHTPCSEPDCATPASVLVDADTGREVHLDTTRYAIPLCTAHARGRAIDHSR